MLFVTHLVGGYIAARLSEHPVPLTVAGAALPDLVDKPLGILEIAPHYHSVGHSIIVAGLFLIVALKFSKLFPVVLGWVTHISMDALHISINRGIEKTTFVFYPFMFPDKPEITNGSVNFI